MLANRCGLIARPLYSMVVRQWTDNCTKNATNLICEAFVKTIEADVRAGLFLDRINRYTVPTAIALCL